MTLSELTSETIVIKERNNVYILQVNNNQRKVKQIKPNSMCYVNHYYQSPSPICHCVAFPECVYHQLAFPESVLLHDHRVCHELEASNECWRRA